MSILVKQKFPDLSYRSFQHPLDRQAIQALEKVKFLDVVIKKFSQWFSERSFRLINISENIRLGPNQCPSLYNKFLEAAAILDIPKLPEIYIDSDPTINAYAYGMENYTIVLCSGLIDILTEEELLAVIGHELGHIKCNHQLYKTLAFILTQFGTELLNNLLPMGIGMVATMSIQLAIYHWYRMAEFSCDRAGLLVVQDPQIVAGALTKIAGYSHKIMPEINLEAVIQQASEYHNSDANVDKFMKLFMVMGRTHPLSVVRVKEIMEWEQSEEYRRILTGDYLTMTAERRAARKSGQDRLCSHCKTLIPDEAKFCFHCGALIPEVTPALEKSCPACNTSNVVGAKFCFKCGTKVA